MAVLNIMIKHQPFAKDGILFDGLVTEVKTGQAVIFKGTFNGNVKVAIKMFLSRSPDEYEQEVAIMRAIPQHENVVSLLHAIDECPRGIAVMPLLEGGSLESFYESHRGAIPPVIIKQYMKQVASGLAHMHSNKIAHLDLKCGNVLISGNNALICDFGFAARINGRANAVFKGAPAFHGS